MILQRTEEQKGRREESAVLVLSDLHLCNERTPEDDDVLDWLAGRLAEHRPRHLVLNGDIFEMSFSVREKKSIDAATVLQELLDTHSQLMSVIGQSASIQRITFIGGEHDYFVMQPDFRMTLRRQFTRATVDVCDHFYDPESETLAFHGHQLDYNLIHRPGDPTLTDRLTEIFEKYIFQSDEQRHHVTEAVRRADFSFWYGAGALPDYMRAARELFGHDANVYFRGLATLLQSEFFREWLREEPNTLNRSVARGARLVGACGPRAVRLFARAWWHVVDRIVQRRSLRVLRGDVPFEAFGEPGRRAIRHLVLGHAHRAEARHTVVEGVRKAIYTTTSPRWHVVGIRKGHLSLYRDSAVVVINQDGTLEYEQRHEAAKQQLRCVGVFGGRPI